MHEIDDESLKLIEAANEIAKLQDYQELTLVRL